jgi:thioredoxin reductase (NADPH)
VFYAATELEARFCGSGPVVVVGGGNAAGQAAMFLSDRSSTVHLIHRGDDLESSMSHYLIARLRKTPNVVLRLGCAIEMLDGSDQQLRGVTFRDADGASEQLPASGLFVMIGAEPCSGWLGGAVELDESGYVLTGIDLPPALDGLPRSGFATSAPGVFAVGDVRSGSVKRVASAVGEGSVVIQQIHRHLASTPITVSHD